MLTALPTDACRLVRGLIGDTRSKKAKPIVVRWLVNKDEADHRTIPTQ